MTRKSRRPPPSPGHNTWSGFFTMLRVAKTYSLPALTPAAGGADTSVFAGYYATLSSLDDFFVLSSGASPPAHT